MDEKTYEGRSSEGHSEAVRDALEQAARDNPGKQITFRVLDHHGEWSANPGNINFIVRVAASA
jgi:hypothetical protein